MRTFIAVDVGDDVRETLTALLGDLGGRVPGVRWSRPGNVHLTLRFLGEVGDDALPEVAAAARAAAARSRPFELRLGRLASFGGRAPRVLVLTVDGEAGGLDALYQALEEELDDRGFGREGRAFRPHLTLGRRKEGSIPGTWADTQVSGANAWEVEELVVYASELTPDGPIYTALARCPLGGEEAGRESTGES